MGGSRFEINRIWRCKFRKGELSFKILDRIPAFVNVEDNAAGEEGVDCTRQSIVPLISVTGSMG